MHLKISSTIQSKDLIQSRTAANDTESFTNNVYHVSLQRGGTEMPGWHPLMDGELYSLSSQSSDPSDICFLMERQNIPQKY